MTCPTCEKRIADSLATVCPHCLAKLPTPLPLSSSGGVFGGFDQQPDGGNVFGGLDPQTEVDPAAHEPFGPPPTEPSVGRKVAFGGLGIGLRIVIAVVAIFGLGLVSQVYRSVTGAGDYTSIEDLQVGQCFDLFDESGDEVVEVGAADVLPCNEPHVFEMVATGDFIGQQAYSETLFDTGLDRCFVLAESYLDLERIPEELFLDVLIPTESGWSSGDRAYLCYVYLDNGLSMNESWSK